MTLRLHAFEPASRANGPGLRAVVWFQGCTIGCPGCFNPGTHSVSDGYETTHTALMEQILAVPGIAGVSISGGEPFQQPEALAELVLALRRSPLSILIYTGYPIDVVRARPHGAEILGNIDVLVAGPYIRERHVGLGLIGSANQRLHLLTGRYRPSDFSAVPASEAIIHRDGSVTVTGFRRFTGISPAAKG